MVEFMTKKLCQRVKGIFCLSLFVFSCYACQTTRDNDGKNIFYDDMVKCTRLVDLFEGADYIPFPRPFVNIFYGRKRFYCVILAKSFLFRT